MTIQTICDRSAILTTTQRAVHQGRHRDETVQLLWEAMDKTLDAGKARGYTQAEYREALLKIIFDERVALKIGTKSL